MSRHGPANRACADRGARAGVRWLPDADLPLQPVDLGHGEPATSTILAGQHVVVRIEDESGPTLGASGPTRRLSRQRGDPRRVVQDRGPIRRLRRAGRYAHVEVEPGSLLLTPDRAVDIAARPSRRPRAFSRRCGLAPSASTIDATVSASTTPTGLAGSRARDGSLHLPRRRRNLARCWWHAARCPIVAAWIFAAGGLAACRARRTLEPMGSGGAGGPTSIGPAGSAGVAGVAGVGGTVTSGQGGAAGAITGGAGTGRWAVPAARPPLPAEAAPCSRSSSAHSPRSRPATAVCRTTASISTVARAMAACPRTAAFPTRPRPTVAPGSTIRSAAFGARTSAPVQSFVRAWHFADRHSPLGRRRLRQRRLRRRRMVGRTVGRRGGRSGEPSGGGAAAPPGQAHQSSRRRTHRKRTPARGRRWRDRAARPARRARGRPQLGLAARVVADLPSRQAPSS